MKLGEILLENLTYVGKVAQTVIKVKIVGPIPAIAISFVRILPTPATIAFGGVPTFERKKKFKKCSNLI
jgi:hypothetical protein